MWGIIQGVIVLLFHVAWFAAFVYEWYYEGLGSAISVAIAIPILIIGAAFIVLALPIILGLAVLLAVPLLLSLAAD